MRQNRNLLRWIVGLALFISLLLLTIPPAKAQPACQQAPNCIKNDSPGNSGIYTAPNTILDFVIKAGQNEFHFAPPGPHDGCYSVSFSTTTNTNDTVTYSKVGSGSECKDISHTETWWHVAPTNIELTSISAESGDRSPLYMVGVPILLFLAAITLAFLTWRHRRNKNNQIGG